MTPSPGKRPPPPSPPTGPPEYRIADLCAELEAYLTPKQIREVYRAFVFGAEAHEGQRRQSGEPYIYHPLAVARILAGMRMDHKCLVAALLHDVIEDTPTAKEQLAQIFDPEVAQLVDGVSKLTQIHFGSRVEAQAANLRKMLLAMTKDIRVILVKLADRLHNMRTLGALRPDKARRIARETLEIYAPIANRLGINSIRQELEDLAFAHYWPWRYRVLQRAVREAHGARKELTETVLMALRRRLRQEGIDAEVLGRRKHLYSIYHKMRSKGLRFCQVMDVYAFRIIVDRMDTCYCALGPVHNLYKPVPGRFKDYIALPKSNGYQSLHTIVIGPHGVPLEIQIRSEAMHRVSQSGIAAHWMYKTTEGGDGGIQARASDWLHNLLDLQQGVGDSVEFLEHVKVDLFPDEVYVFTPQGRVMVLPQGATVVDFAYAVHSDLGNTCVAARVNQRFVPLSTRLHSGQTVEIIPKTDAHPRPEWLAFVVTPKARTGIRIFLRNLERREAIDLGRRLLDSELAAWGITLDQIRRERIQGYIEQMGIPDLDELCRQVALGDRLPLLVARQLVGEDVEAIRQPTPRTAGHLAIKGSEGMAVCYAKCCRPIPGDAIRGMFHPGKGLVVHRAECHNLGEPTTNWVQVEWDCSAHIELPTGIRISVTNQRGVLARLAAAISSQGCNIEDVGIEEQDGLSSRLRFVVTVRDRQHLAGLIRHLRGLEPVQRIQRVMQ